MKKTLKCHKCGRRDFYRGRARGLEAWLKAGICYACSQKASLASFCAHQARQAVDEWIDKVFPQRGA